MTAAELADYIETLFPKEHFRNGVPPLEAVNHSWYSGQAGQVGAILEGLAGLSLDGLDAGERSQVAEVRGDLGHARQRWATEPRNVVGREHALPARRVAQLYHLLRRAAATIASDQGEGRELSAKRFYATVDLDTRRLAEGVERAMPVVRDATARWVSLSWSHADGLSESKRFETPQDLARFDFPADTSEKGFSLHIKNAKTGNTSSIHLYSIYNRIAITCSGASTSAEELNALFSAFEGSLGLTRLEDQPEPPPPSDPAFLVTMDRLVPSAAAAYRQAIEDLNADRLSYRGPANEFRQALWDVLDTLGPDDAVTAAPGYRTEKGQKGPTLRQRAAYIMRTLRGEEPSATDLDAIEPIAALTRITYSRSNKSTHADHGREEALQVQRWIEAVLRDLLKEGPQG